MSWPIADALLPWFEQHGRKNLPWQQQVSAYRVWLSEIMLQQTQVTTVIPYFERFIQRFPSVVALAAASQDDVLQHWAGLGYYARARNLHKTAQVIVQQFGAEFPQTLDQLEALPGIGRSTAGAILSLAFQQAAAILDGNVKRVLTRVYCVDGWAGQSAVAKKLWHIAEQQTPPQQAASYNQAMMDLGSMVCTRSRPCCEECPLTSLCLSYQQGTQSLYPQAKPKKAKPQRHRWFLLHHHEEYLLLQKRPPSGIWGGLWSLPELADLAELADWQQQWLGHFNAQYQCHENLLRHAFTHFELYLSLARIECSDAQRLQVPDEVRDSTDLCWIKYSQLATLGLPAPITKILQMPAVTGMKLPLADH